LYTIPQIITPHYHVFPRRFISPNRRQPNPSHQATSRTRSRRRKRKTARRGNTPPKHPIYTFPPPASPTCIPLTHTLRESETQRTLLRTLYPQTWFFAVVGRVNLLLSMYGKVHVCVECCVQAIHQSHTERSWFWRSHDVNTSTTFSRHTRPQQQEGKREERERGPIV
jgi:hypothetical protein